MIKEHLEQLQSRLEQASGLSEETKAELLRLVATVKQETGVEDGPETQSGFSNLVGELEASHPELAASINQVANTLSKMGI